MIVVRLSDSFILGVQAFQIVEEFLRFASTYVRQMKVSSTYLLYNGVGEKLE